LRNIAKILLLVTLSYSFVIAQNHYANTVNPFAENIYFTLKGGSNYSLTDYNNSKLGLSTGIALGYYLSTHSKGALGFEILGGTQKFKGENNFLGFPNDFTTKSTMIGGRINYAYSLSNTFIPVLSAGASYLWFKFSNANTTSRNIKITSGGNLNSLVLDIEPEVKLKLSDLFAVEFGIGFHFIQNDNLDAVSFGNHNDYFISGNIGFSFSLHSVGDSDGDGILDNIDKCPDKKEDFDGYEDEDGCPDLDNDKDGIPDVVDKCPYTQEDYDGFEDNDGCPDIDNDNDGIFDLNDKCKNEAEDFDGFQDDDGCPDYDNDGDKIPDSLDQCPNNPETFNGYKDNDGCPDVKPDYLIKKSRRNLSAKVKIPNLFVLHSENIFVNETGKIKSSAYPKLMKIISLLKKNPNAKWRIEGHVDSKERKMDAINISRNQAKAILDYFVSMGLPEKNFVIMGMGDAMPVSPNKTIYGRLKNRRIKIIRIK